jgi:serine/threonine-protein kinase
MPPGTSFDRYTILAGLGHGGMAEVYLAVSRGFAGFHKLMVLKKLRDDLASDASFGPMFLDEARLAARLNHPNIVQTYEIGKLADGYFIVMEYLEGQPLSRVMRLAASKSRSRGGMPLPIALRTAADICAALHYAHELRDFDGKALDVVHRDVSPHNVFVTYEGHVKLVDFGIALANTRTTRTETGILKGRIAYMAPEQAQGVEVDRGVDIFAAGAVLFEMITGSRLWGHRGDVDIMRDLLSGRGPSAIEGRLPTLPGSIARIVHRALASNKKDRFASALEMRQELEEAIEQLPTPATAAAIANHVTALFANERAEVDTMIERRLEGIKQANGLGGSLLRVPSCAQAMAVSASQTPSGGMVRQSSRRRLRSTAFATSQALGNRQRNTTSGDLDDHRELQPAAAVSRLTIAVSMAVALTTVAAAVMGSMRPRSFASPSTPPPAVATRLPDAEPQPELLSPRWGLARFAAAPSHLEPEIEIDPDRGGIPPVPDRPDGATDRSVLSNAPALPSGGAAPIASGATSGPSNALLLPAAAPHSPSGTMTPAPTGKPPIAEVRSRHPSAGRADATPDPLADRK